MPEVEEIEVQAAPEVVMPLFECAACGQRGLEASAVTRLNARWICDDCLVACDNCGETVRSDNTTTTNTGSIWCECCASDLYSCRSCGDVYESDDELRSVSGRLYCESCFEDSFCTCDACDTTIRQCDAISTNDGRICFRCNANNRIIKDYGYSPEFNFKSQERKDNPKSATFLGIELEMESTRSSVTPEALAEIVKKHMGDTTYCKRDGSLRNGLELVTHPQTLTFFKKDKARWVALLAELMKNGARSHSTTTAGLHVHFSKDKFATRAERLKLRRFFYLCETDLKKFSRRDNFSYCEFEHEYPKDSWSQEGRFWAFNPNASQQTYEVRLFRGSLVYATLRACVEFSDAVGQFTLAHSGVVFRLPYRRNKKLWNMFRKFVYAGNQWKYLSERIGKPDANNENEEVA